MKLRRLKTASKAAWGWCVRAAAVAAEASNDPGFAVVAGLLMVGAGAGIQFGLGPALMTAGILLLLFFKPLVRWIL